MRILTAQSKDVIDILECYGIYTSCKIKQREKRSYEREVELLSGFNPVWGLKVKDEDNLYDGIIINRLSQEMSLQRNAPEALKDYYLIELEVEDSLVQRGITHSDSDYVVVFPYIMRDMINGIYKVFNANHWYIPGVKIIKMCNTSKLV